jgi:hypothetical protein
MGVAKQQGAKRYLGGQRNSEALKSGKTPCSSDAQKRSNKTQGIVAKYKEEEQSKRSRHKNNEA